MQVQNLQLSNIVSKQQHYLLQQNRPSFQFQHQPLTHKVQKMESHSQKRLMRDLELKERRCILDKSERIKKQLLLQKIATKNYRFQIRQNTDKWNKKAVQFTHFLNRNKSSELQKFTDTQNPKIQNSNIQKIYLTKKKAQFSSTKGFNTGKYRDQMMRKTFNTQDSNQIKTKQVKQIKQLKQKKKIKQVILFKEIKLKAIKLPQLNCMKQEKGLQISKGGVNIVEKQQISQEYFQIQNKKRQKAKDQTQTNPILKVHDVRYFGIQQRSEDFEKVQKNLLRQIRKKYWSYESLDHEQVYNNFQNLLAQQFS